jgi:hypothetical protein
LSRDRNTLFTVESRVCAAIHPPGGGGGLLELLDFLAVESDPWISRKDYQADQFSCSMEFCLDVFVTVLDKGRLHSGGTPLRLPDESLVVARNLRVDRVDRKFTTARASDHLGVP